LITIAGAGIGYSLLSFLDIGSAAPKLNLTKNLYSYFGSAVFSFVQSGWVLPSFALLNLIVLIGLSWENFHARKYVGRVIASQIKETPTVERASWVEVTGLPHSLETVEQLVASPSSESGPAVNTADENKNRDRSNLHTHTHQHPGVHDRQKSELTWSDPFEVKRDDSFRS